MAVKNYNIYRMLMYIATMDPGQACYLLFVIENHMARNLIQIIPYDASTLISALPPIEGTDAGYGNYQGIIDVVESMDASHSRELNFLRALADYICDTIDDESSESSSSSQLEHSSSSQTSSQSIDPFDERFWEDSSSQLLDLSSESSLSSHSSSSLSSDSSSLSQTSASSTSSDGTSSYWDNWEDQFA